MRSLRFLVPTLALFSTQAAEAAPLPPEVMAGPRMLTPSLAPEGADAIDFAELPRLPAEHAVISDDKTAIIFDGQSPDKLVCDTTLRAMPDGSWVMVMLGGGDKEPHPRNGVYLTRCHDEGKSWSPMQPLDFGFPDEGDTFSQVPTELMVHDGICTLFFATHDGTFGGWKTWTATSRDSCRTWSEPRPAPGRLHDRTFIRNHIVTKDGRILLPFQHYLDPPRSNTRNGVLMSSDGGVTWQEHGDIRLSNNDRYRGWAENNIAELADGTIVMIIRADSLGGVLYEARSEDGGRTWPEYASKTAIPNPGSKATLYSLGGDTVALLHNPNPKHRSPLALWISFDGLKTWPYQRVLVPESSDGPKGRLNYPDGFVSADKRYLHFAFDDNRHRAVYIGARLPDVSPAGAAAKSPANVAAMEKIADLALVPPVLNTSPLPDYGYDRLDYGMTIGIERSPGGRLWACWVAGGDSPDAFFVLATSDDDGESWSDPCLVVDSHEEEHPFPRSILVGNLWTDPKGRLWLFFDQSMDMFDGRAGVWATVCENPDADEPKWSAPERIWHGVMLNKPTVLSTGEWMLPISLDQREGFREFKGCFRELDPLRGANVLVSSDEGETWQRRAAVQFPNPNWHEHMIVEKSDGCLWMLARTGKGIMESTSTDSGKTWSDPVKSAIKQPVARFFIRRLQSGKLLLVKHGDRIDSHRGRVKLSAWLSDDDGASWQGGLVLDERKGISYPDGFQAPDGTIYISYDRNRSADGEILLARFTEGDVMAKEFQGPKSRARMLISRPMGLEKRRGFTFLADGHSFSGWQNGGNWIVDDEGAFFRKERGGDLLYTAAKIPEDFELRFEWKVSKGCNSGVYYRPGQVEYQVLDNIGSPYGANARQAAASLFFCMAPKKDNTRPVGEWNTGRIVCQGSVIEHWLNGEAVVSFDYEDPKWAEYVGLLGIRGGDLTGRGAQIKLQDHGQDVWYRHLRLRENPGDETITPDPDFVPMPVTGAALKAEQQRVRKMQGG